MSFLQSMQVATTSLMVEDRYRHQEKPTAFVCVAWFPCRAIAGLYRVYTLVRDTARISAIHRTFILAGRSVDDALCYRHQVG